MYSRSFISKVQDAPIQDVGDIHFFNGKCSTLALLKRLKQYQDINELHRSWCLSNGQSVSGTPPPPPKNKK